MTSPQHSSVDDELHNLLDSFFEPSKDEKYVRDLERDIMALIEAEKKKAEQRGYNKGYSECMKEWQTSSR